MDEDSQRLLVRYVAHARVIDGRPTKTAEDYRSDVASFLDYLHAHHPGVSLQTVTSEHVTQWMIHLDATGRAPATRKRRLLGLRSFMARLHVGDAEANPALGVPTPRVPPVKTEVFTDSEVRQILTYAETAVLDLRRQVGHVALVMFFTTGLRLSEVAGLRIADVDLAGRRLRVTGKGDKERRVPLTTALAEMLANYLAELRPRLPGDVYLLANPQSYAHRRFHGRFNPQSLGLLVKQMAHEAGVVGKTNPYKWRHTYATKVFVAGPTCTRSNGFSGTSTSTRHCATCTSSTMTYVPPSTAPSIPRVAAKRDTCRASRHGSPDGTLPGGPN